MIKRTVCARFLLMLIMAGALVQCHRAEPVLAPAIVSLIGTWRLVEPDSTYGVTLTIELDTKNPPHDVTPFLASGKSPANEYTLQLFVSIDGMMLSDNLSTTERGGTQQAMTFEKRYYANLRAAARYELPVPNRLRLYHGGETPYVMVYEKIK